MLSIGKLSAAQVETYHLALAAPDPAAYYRGEGEAPPVWVGAAAERLGLAGQADPDDLRQLLDAVDPVSGRRLVGGQAARGRTRPAFDLTFSAPKGVSLAMAFAEPVVRAQVIDAHDTAVADALGYVERRALAVRRGAGGAVQLRAGGGLVGAAFGHRSSRAADPQLHTHVVVANLGAGPHGSWSALDGRLLFSHARTAGFLYEAALRRELTDRLGWEWGPVRNGIAEPAGWSRAELDAFSRRRTDIVAAMELAGVTSANAGRIAVLATRPPKEPTSAHLTAEWRRRGAELGINSDRVVAMGGRTRAVALDADAIAQAAVGAGGLCAHQATFDRRAVLGVVAERAALGASVAEIEAVADRILAHREVLAVRPDQPERVGDDVARYTTAELLGVEADLIAGAVARRDNQVGVVGADVVEKVLAARPTLSVEQQTMIRRIVTGGDGVAVVVGRAGAGKTFALDAARHAWTSAGVPVVGAALSARAAAELEAGSGIRSMTLARLLDTADRPEPHGGGLAPGGVVVVDEAAMVGTRDLRRLAQLAAGSGTKLVLVGDHRQVPEIAAGGAFAALAGRLDAVELVDNRRQHNAWERDALSELRHGSVTTAVSAYVEHGRVTVAPTAPDARAALVADWQTARSEGAEVLMLAARRADAEDLNRLARHALGAAGQLGNVEVDIGGRPFSVGDEVMATRNRWRTGLINGARATITTLDERTGTLGLRGADGSELTVTVADAEAAKLTHAYAMTVHKAQGATVDRAFLLGSDTLYRELGYVAMSRARQRSDFYIVGGDERRHEHAHAPEAQPDPHDELAARLRTSRAQTLGLDTAGATLADLRIARDRLERQLAAGPPDPTRRIDAVQTQLHALDQQSGPWAERDRARLRADLEALGAETAARRQWHNRHAELTAEIGRLDELTNLRRRHLARTVDAAPPPSVQAALGSPPTDPHDRQTWRDAAGALVAHHERWGITKVDTHTRGERSVAERLEAERVERHVRDAAHRLGVDTGRALDRGIDR